MKAKILNTALWIAVGFFACLLYVNSCQQVNDVLPVKTVAEIKQEVAAEANPAEDRIKALSQEKANLQTDNKTMEQKLFAAWQENKRLKAVSSKNAQAEKWSNSTTLKSIENDEIELSGNPGQLEGEQDFTPTVSISEIVAAAALSDSICADVINNLHDQIGTQDSIDQQRQVQIAAFIKGLENMADNSLQKDAVIKSINKKLKWQKAQNLGLKAVVIAGAVFILKNNL